MRLSINIDHIATLRNARGGKEPDPVTAAHIAELAGADGIVCHLREDRRHINDRDVQLLRETVKTKLDLEMSIAEDIVVVAENILPDLVTLVPEKRVDYRGGGYSETQRKIHTVIKECTQKYSRQSLLTRCATNFVTKEIQQI